jgi:hypothetical protein
MTRVEGKVFTDKLEALRYNREQAGEFYEATIPGEEPKTVYVVAVSLHRAQVALVDYLMDVTKWPKRKQDVQYIAALEAETGKAKDEQMPLFDEDAA